MQTFPIPLTASEEEYYVKKYMDGDLEAKKILVERNLRLVAHIAKKYQGPEDDSDDLISIGTIGLIKAVLTFDPEKNSRLGTYAARCITNEILMMHRSKKKIAREVSLYEPIGTDREGNEIQLFDVIEASDADTLRQITYQYDVLKLYQTIQTALSEREQLVLRQRYGLYGEKIHTQKEVAHELNISRSYISRIEKGAIEKLRKFF